jgi:hypothetical protein
VNLYEFVGSDPERWLDPFGLVPRGNPGDWGWGRGSRGNCWRYACNDPAKDGESSGVNPGGRNLRRPFTCGDVLKGARKNPGIKPPGPDGNCPKCTYKIFLVITPPGPEQDYHWYRQDDDGSWSGKPGDTPVVPVPPGRTPKEDARRRGYPIECGYLCVSGSGVDLDRPDLDDIANEPRPRPWHRPAPHGHMGRRNIFSY